MQLGRLRTNHLENPVGFLLDKVVFSWVVEESTGTVQQAARIEVSEREDFSAPVYDSGKREDLSSLECRAPVELRPRTRYFWRVTVWADDGDTGSACAFFETGKRDEAWRASWITPPFDKETHPVLRRDFAAKDVVRARAYACGLGLYELYLNDRKVGDEVLAPYYNDYSNWIQLQTWDLTPLLAEGENTFAAMLGNGWYKGRFGFIKGGRELYGDKFLFLCEIVLTHSDGSETVIGTGEDWLCAPSPVLESSIYDGEIFDRRHMPAGWEHVRAAAAPAAPLCDRLSPPLRVIEKIGDPVLIRTPAGEDVLDFGQEVTGWVEFECHLPAGHRILLQYGEILQGGNFYQENLRTAKQEYTFISDGEPRHVRPHFTFYGFRYVKVTGLDTVHPEDFTACVIHSDLLFTAEVETGNEKVNRLALNALWGQRGNFVDVPTDCPQRDERMGWTGDAQVFSATASFFMETPAFFHKYLHDMLLEQQERGGSVPHVVPDMIRIVAQKHPDDYVFSSAHGSCAWGDAATVIPWNIYRFFGDRTLLRRHYPNMKAWTDYIRGQDDAECGSSRLWTCGFHFADWLSLDNPEKGSSFGGTDPYFIASAYYYYSASLTAKAARVLGETEDAEYYETLAGEVRDAIRREYFTSTGRLAADTQTGHVFALAFDLVPPEHRERTVRDLRAKLDAADGHLRTGFVGTAYLCETLSRNGLNDYAYTLLLNEDYPSWLYEVNMGATTVWERWNSVLPDGSISDTGMNSLNHYAYGAILEWVFRYVCGINPEEPGFRKIRLAPLPDRRLGRAKAVYHSASGTIVSEWEYQGDELVYTFTVPFNTAALLVLPGEAQRTLHPGTYTFRTSVQM